MSTICPGQELVVHLFQDNTEIFIREDSKVRLSEDKDTRKILT